MQLLYAHDGQWVRVTGFLGGARLEKKLGQLGLLPGDRVQILRHAPFGGPVLIEVEGRSIALGRGIASKIEVEEIKCVSL